VKRLGILILILVALALGYFATARVLSARLPDATPTTAAKLDWLAREFALTPAQLEAIAKLQADYAPICADHCAAIVAAQERVAAAAKPADLAVAKAELARLEQVCAVATRAHLQSVAACMPGHQAARFLAMMEPRVAHNPDRNGAPALDGQP
jgi:hypothetical protein